MPLLIIFLIGAGYLECYKHFKKFELTSLRSHVTVTCRNAFISGDQAVNFYRMFLGVTWITRLLIHLQVCWQCKMLFSEVYDVLICNIQWRSSQHHTLWINTLYYMASSASGQDEPNRALWLATQAGGQDGAILPARDYPPYPASKISPKPI